VCERERKRKKRKREREKERKREREKEREQCKHVLTVTVNALSSEVMQCDTPSLILNTQQKK